MCTLIIVAGCAQTHDHRGHMIEPEDLARVHVKKDDKETVRTVLGSPTFIDSFAKNQWIYAYQHTTRRSFMHPDTVQFQAIRLTFAKNGTLSRIDKEMRTTIPGVTPTPVSTKTSGHRSTFIQQLFGNFGKYRHNK
ncbi:MAG: outer membrane protein assembly factor BamE [Alphaproteobacteria bacterium]|nr:MAG: outer membrane protein assembly factor BamE [Alphaproteobacteria bacterium]